MKLRSHFFAAALVFTLAALVIVAGASAATVRISTTGTFTTGPTDPATVDVAAASDLGGTNPTGTIVTTLPSAPPGAPTNVFHGDVANGCVRHQGNLAVVVGLLPANEQYVFPNFGTVAYNAAVIEDNGVAGATPVDRGRPILLRESSKVNWCTTMTFASFAALLVNIESGDVGLGYTDQLDGLPGNPDTGVSVINPNGLSVTITDEPDGVDGQGLNVAVGAGSGKAKLSACGFPANVNNGSTVVFTCASLITEVLIGSAEVELEDGLSFVSIPDGGKAEITEEADGSFTVENLGTVDITVDLGDGLAVVSIPEDGIADITEEADGSFTVENLGTVDITVVVDGVEATIEPDETSTFEAWDFQGFTGLGNPPALNKAKAGSSVALKWRIVDATGAPVTDLSTATITVSDVNCMTRADLGIIQPGQTGGLQNLGNGSYQLNWKTQKSWSGCKAAHLDIGDGVTHDAYFEFK